MENLKLYYINDEYINYLRMFDDRVFYNKIHSRPYVGVVYKCNDKTYFAPLSSPKPKHLKISKKSPDVFKLADGELGVVNINNMIPTPLDCIVEALPLVKDIKYKMLLQKQITYINNHKSELFSKIKYLYETYKKGYLDERVMKRCCDFSLLEQKCIEYRKEKVKF